MSCRDCRSRTRPCPATAKRSCLLLRIARHRRAVSVGLGLAAAWLGPYRDANAVTPTKQSEPLTSGAWTITSARASSQLHRPRRSASVLQVLAELVTAGIGSWGYGRPAVAVRDDPQRREIMPLVQTANTLPDAGWRQPR